MGFWQNLADSYDKNADALSRLYPLSTTSISNGDMIVIIIIDGNGNFLGYDRIEKANRKKGIETEFVTIPASEESLKRTSTAILPYPVFEQYGYLKGMVGESDEDIQKLYKRYENINECIKEHKRKKNKDEKHLKKLEEDSKKIKPLVIFGKKYDAYIDQLKGFAESKFATEHVKAIYQYVTKRTIASDLSEVDLKDSINILFQVEIPGLLEKKVWKDEKFFNAWYQYYSEVIGKENTKSLDYISGTIQPTATFHPKKISNASANAKLISANDDKNFTFRGKFNSPIEAVSIGYETSQKAHQFLRYLINENRGYRKCGEQVILSFTIGSNEKLFEPPIEEKSIHSLLQEFQPQTASDKLINLRAETGIDYADALRKSLEGFKYGTVLKQHPKTAVMALDAVSDKSGRLSITFYRELYRSEYLEKIADWHEGCKWNQKFWDKETERYIPYTGAPSVDTIIEAVYGKGNDKSYTKIKKAARERLIRCIFDGAFLPKDYVVSAVRRASNPLGITKNKKFDPSGFDQIVSTACALVRKDFKQFNKEEYKLSIELNRTDRDYLYGRLLGAADKLEERGLKEKEKKRTTAAIRHMQSFAQHPFRTWQTIHSCLNPYLQMFRGDFAFNEIQAVKQLFMAGDFEKDIPLNGSYLIGYYHERAYIEILIRAASDKNKSNNEKENDNDGQ